MGIGVKRGYEILPNNDVVFGVRVTNDSDLVVSDVQVILDYNESLFSLQEDRIQKLDNIPPTIPRTAKFLLKPLGCVHKENIEATISYRDHKWEKHMVTMKPKEVHCVCPFLRSKPITRNEFIHLSENGHSLGLGMNFEGISTEQISTFLMQTCSTRLYVVDNFPISEGNVIYFSGESIGEKANYLLTALIKENEGLTQVMFRAVSDKTHGIHGFLNEIVSELKHLVNTVNSAKEIGVIRNEQVINIIDSVVQRTNISSFGFGAGKAVPVNIKSSVIQRSTVSTSQPSGKDDEISRKYDAYLEDVKARKREGNTHKVTTAEGNPRKKKGERKKLLIPILLVLAAFLTGYLIPLNDGNSSDDYSVYPATQSSLSASKTSSQEESASLYIKYIEAYRAKNTVSDMSGSVDLLKIKIGLKNDAEVDMSSMKILISDGSQKNSLVYAGSDSSFGTVNSYAAKNLKHLLTISGNPENFFTAEVVYDSDSSFSQSKPIMNQGDHIAIWIATTSDSATTRDFKKLGSTDVLSGLESSGLNLVPGTKVSIVIKPEEGTALSVDLVTPSSYGTKESMQIYS